MTCSFRFAAAWWLVLGITAASLPAAACPQAAASSPAAGCAPADAPPARYLLRQYTGSAAAMPTVLAKASRIPLRKTFAQMTPQEADVVRSFYTEMGPGDEPPFPKQGLGPLVRLLHRAQQKLFVTGGLYLVADVDAAGKVNAVVAHGSPSPEMTQFAASALLLTEFKPALCAGVPCAQQYPFALNFVVE